MGNVLIIDDDRTVCGVMAKLLEREGHTTSSVLSLKEGVREATAGDFDVVFLDVMMPDGNGLDVIPEIRSAGSQPEIIIMTGRGDADGAKIAIECGAWDYVEKSGSLSDMILPLTRALLYRENHAARDSLDKIWRKGIIGESPRLISCLELVAQTAKSDVNVLITGETGTGKELFAWSVHKNSLRARKDFVVVDCAALPESLVESLLLGHAKGAFTGADADKAGLIQQAHDGTLFLDEIGELPLSLQKAFLRVLQERKFRPVGAQHEVESRFRLVSATNRNLDKLTQEGLFRKDLLHRIRSLTINLPPLRECSEDIRIIAEYHLEKIGEKRGPVPEMSPEYLAALLAYKWPGNVRELMSVIETSVATAEHAPILLPQHLPNHVRLAALQSFSTKDRWGREERIAQTNLDESELPTLQECRDRTDREYFARLLSATGGDIKETCRISGLSRSRIYAYLKKHGLTPHV